MLESSRGRRARAARRWQRLFTATMCAASFLTGEIVFAQQPGLVGRPQLRAVAVEAAPLAVKPAVAARPEGELKQNDEALPPIRSAANMPRPSRGKPANSAVPNSMAQGQNTAATGSLPGVPGTPGIQPGAPRHSLPPLPMLNPNQAPNNPAANNAATPEAGLPLEAILGRPVENIETARSAPGTPSKDPSVALPAGKPASTGPWMQDIREMIRSTPGPKPAVDANKIVAQQVQYEKPEPTAPVGPPTELIAKPLGQATAAAPIANNGSAGASPSQPAPAFTAPSFTAPTFTPPASAPEVKEVAKEQPAPEANLPTLVKPAPQPLEVALPKPAVISPTAAQPTPAQPVPAQVAAPPKPKKLAHLAPMNPAYEAAAQARGIAQVKAENALPPLTPPPQLHDAQLQSNPTAQPLLQPQPVNFTQPPMAIQPPPLAPTPQAPAIDPVADAMRRAGSPFEIIDETGAVQVMVRRSKLLRTKVDIYRTAVVDDSICEIVQFTPREVSLIGKSQGSTHVTFWFDDPNMQPVTYVIQVVPDVAKVKEAEDTYRMLQDVINEMFPDSKIQLLIVADKLIIRGQAKDSEEAAQIVALVRSQTGGYTPGAGAGGMGGGFSEGAAAQVLSDSATGASQRSRLQVINMLRVPGVQQVALRVKIAEMNRSAARGFGVDVKGNVNFTDNPDGSQMFLQSMLNVAAGAGPALLTQVDGDDIQIGVRYLQSHGVLRLLSEPTLVTMSGTPATFIAGGEFAVPTLVGSAGLNAVTTDFRAFGAIISFMPTVIDKDRIRLQVSPEFSQINSALTVNNTPGLRVRAATTTVEMREGQTLAIAGLLEDNMNGTNAGDLPFLAKVFGRREMNRNETELLILVAPELVHAMEAEEVPPLPGFDITEPTSAQFFLHGRLEGNPTQDYRSTVWPRMKKRYGAGGPAMTSGPFGHGQ